MHMHLRLNEKKGLGWCSAAGVGLAAMGLALVSCTAKTAALHSAPFFSPTPTRQATNAVDAGDGDLEIAGLRRSMMSRPDDVEVRLRLAQAYAVRGFQDVALEHYRLAAERFPDSLPAAVRLARALRKADQKEEALAGLQAFAHTHPQQTAQPYEWLGVLNDDLQNWKASQLAYETALLYAPSSTISAELHNNLGYSLLMQHLNNAAAAEFRIALAMKKDLAIARNNLGIALAGNPSLNRSDAILNWQAISGPAAAHNNMAALLIERGDYPGARKELETALGYDQQNAQAIFNLALVSERDGKPGVIPTRKLGAPAGTEASAKPVRQASALSRFFHLGRHSDKPAEALSDAQTAARAVTPVGSGNGN